MLIGVLLLLFVAPAHGTSPKPSDRPPNERRQIERLRFSEKTTKKDAFEKLERNFKRDCGSLGYSQKDSDLTPQSVLSTYPKQLLQSYVEKNFLTLCPRNFVLALKHLESIPLKKHLTREYGSHFKDDPYWPYSYLNELSVLFETLADHCSQNDITAFSKLFCKYNEQEKEGWQSIYLKNFIKACPAFASKTLPCKLSGGAPSE